MKSTPILQGKHAVVFGAGGSIGSAVAREFAREGAEVFLSGRSKSSVEPVAEQIVARGGTAHIDVLDTLDEDVVSQYIDGIAKQAGKIDIVLDAVGPLAKEYGNTRLAVDLPVDSGHNGVDRQSTEHHKGSGDGANRTIQFSEGLRDCSGHRQCGRTDRIGSR